MCESAQASRLGVVRTFLYRNSAQRRHPQGLAETIPPGLAGSRCGASGPEAQGLAAVARTCRSHKDFQALLAVWRFPAFGSLEKSGHRNGPGLRE